MLKQFIKSFQFFLNYRASLSASISTLQVILLAPILRRICLRNHAPSARPRTSELSISFTNCWPVPVPNSAKNLFSRIPRPTRSSRTAVCQWLASTMWPSSNRLASPCSSWVLTKRTCRLSSALCQLRSSLETWSLNRIVILIRLHCQTTLWHRRLPTCSVLVLLTWPRLSSSRASKSVVTMSPRLRPKNRCVFL